MSIKDKKKLLSMYCKCGNPVENKETGLCASCAHDGRKLERLAKKEVKKPKSIPRRSQKMEIIMEEYNRRRPGFLYKKKCAVYPDLPATTIHHMRGRDGYADDYARENDIPLILDERFWLPTSLKGHQKITDYPAWAIQQGFSLERLKTTDL